MIQILHFNELKSTQEFAREHVDDFCSPTAIVADYQSGGIGQGDHSWHSSNGENILMTLALHQDLPVLSQKAISDETAQIIIDFLAAHGISAWKKEPNDIYVGANKICGLLIEHRVVESIIVATLIGIGLNVNQTRFPGDIPNPTSMAIEVGKAFDLEALRLDFLSYFERMVNKV